MSKYIITADIHLKPDKPRCRLDENWIETQRNHIVFIYNTAIEEEADVIIAGDLFHYPHVPDHIKNIFLEIALASMRKTYIIAGQHDLPWHSWNNVNKSSFGTIWELVKSKHPFIRNANEIADAFHYGQYKEGTEKEIVILHRAVYRNEVPEFMGDGITTDELLNQFPKAKHIIAGDNHSSFVYRQNNSFVIVPGCLNRQSVDKKEYNPCIYLLNTDNSLIKVIFVPDDVNLVTDEYLKDEEERNDRIEAFVSSITKGKNVSLSFKDNLKQAIRENKDKLGRGPIEIIQGLLGRKESI